MGAVSYGRIVVDPDPSSKRRRPVYKDSNLQIVFGVTLMSVLGVASITPAFPRIGRELGLSSQSVGLLVTAFTLPGVALAPVLGVLADRWGRKRILVPALVLFGLAGGACALARDFNLLLLLRFVQGIGGASLGSLNVTIIGDLYRGQERANAMGYNASVLSVGTASYPAVGGALATLGWYYPFVLPLVAVPIGLLVLLALNNPEPTDDQQLRSYLRQVWESVKSRRAVGVFAASLLTFIILYGAFLTYLPFLMEESFGATSLVIGLAMSGMSAVTAVAASQLGRLSRRFSKTALVKTAFGFYAAGMLIMPLAPKIWVLAIPIALFGLGHGLNIPGIQTLLAELAPMEYRGAFMSANSMVLRLGQTCGPLLMGVMFGWRGVSAVFWAGATVAIGGVVLLALLLD
jgi:ACDE family multidrug resistance protein